MTSALLFQPLDVIKTRKQVEDCTRGIFVRNQTTYRALRHIYSVEGVVGLFKGAGATAIAAGTSFGIFRYLFDHMRAFLSAQRLAKLSSDDLSKISSIDNCLYHENMVAALIAGLFSTFLVHPLWLIKTRLEMQAFETKKAGWLQYQGTWHCFLTIMRDKRPKGLFVGLGPALALVPHPVIQMFLYEELKKKHAKSLENQIPILPIQMQEIIFPFTCGAVSKLTAVAITYPLQVLRARQQLLSSREASQTFLKIFEQIFRYFLLNFELNGSAIYRDHIRNLKRSRMNQSCAISEKNQSFLLKPYPFTLKLDFEHILMVNWTKKATKFNDEIKSHGNQLSHSSALPVDMLKQNEYVINNSSMLSRKLTNKAENWREVLTNAFLYFPLKSIPVGEEVVRQIYLEMTDQNNYCSYAEPSGFVNSLPPKPIINTLNHTDLGFDQKEQKDYFLKEKVYAERLINSFQLEIISRQRIVAIRNLTAETVERLITTTGIVIQASKPVHKAIRVRIKCQQCEHEQLINIPTWKERVDLPKRCAARGNFVRQSNIIGLEQELCPIDPYFILSDDSQYCDIQTIKLQELPEHVPRGDMPRHILLSATNSLSDRVIPGQRVLVVGVYTTACNSKHTLIRDTSIRSSNDAYIHVLGLDLLEKPLMDSARLPSDKYSMLLTNAQFFSSSVEEKEFHMLAKDKFVYEKIFASIAPSIYGLQDVKKSIACLLFGGSSKSLSDGTKLRGDINILLLGDPSTAKSQFLKFAQKVAPIAIFTSGKGSSAAGLTAAVIRDTNKNFALEGGAMVLADGGVVCIDEFDKMRDDDRVSIHEVMEQQTISIAKAGITTILTTRCSVLAAANPTFGSYDEMKENAEQHDFESTILSRFDLIWLIRDSKDVKKDQSVAKHVMNLHFEQQVLQTPRAPISLELLKKYIFYCRSNCCPILSSEAARKLENYYVDIRQSLRSSGCKLRDQIPITVRQLESLSRIAQSLAKMSLSSHVSAEHVEIAIHLFKLSTVESSRSTSEHLTNNLEKVKINSAEHFIMQKMQLNCRCNKNSILKDLQLKGIERRHALQAIKVLIKKGHLEEKGDTSVKRVVPG